MPTWPPTLYPWLRYADLRRQLDTLDPARAREFLARHGGQAAGEAFRELWVMQSWRRKDWASLQAAWTHALARSTELRCAQLESRQATGDAGPVWIDDMEMWTRDRNVPEVLDRERLNCPFGLSDGAWVAWRFANMMATRRGVTM